MKKIKDKGIAGTGKTSVRRWYFNKNLNQGRKYIKDIYERAFQVENSKCKGSETGLCLISCAQATPGMGYRSSGNCGNASALHRSPEATGGTHYITCPNPFEKS